MNIVLNVNNVKVLEESSLPLFKRDSIYSNILSIYVNNEELWFSMKHLFTQNLIKLNPFVDVFAKEK